jgi:uncharacterized protein (DUF427 family)
MSDQRIPPGPGQESVWDYPRPPRVAPTSKRVQIMFKGVTIVDTTAAIRVLETSHPPAYYIPPQDIMAGVIQPAVGKSVCEFKGAARYWTVNVQGLTAPKCAWSYPIPLAGFETIRDYVAFYASRMDACYVDGELVRAQEGDFYGGWITNEIVGPFKGSPGTWFW